MKYIIASDIHGSAKYAREVLRIFEQEQADYLLLLGDLLYHGPRNPLPQDYAPQEVAVVLNSLKEKIIAVRGNCDSEVDQMLLDFPIMSDSNMLPFENRKIMLSHGHVYHEENLPKNLVAGDVFMFGHIHLPVLKVENGIHIFNPGSVSMPKEGHPNTYGVLENDQLQIKTFAGQIYRSSDIA
ncbi:MAG: phosphodiesterase [Turicibacter sp.]|nr:phosphodiesterase [Turicibacter sp.]